METLKTAIYEEYFRFSGLQLCNDAFYFRHHGMDFVPSLTGRSGLRHPQPIGKRIGVAGAIR